LGIYAPAIKPGDAITPLLLALTTATQNHTKTSAFRQTRQSQQCLKIYISINTKAPKSEAAIYIDALS